MYHHFKKKGENQLKCSNEIDAVQTTKVSLLRNVITLNTGEKTNDGSEIIFCFSCSDLSYYDNVDDFRKHMIGVVRGMGDKDRSGITSKGTISDSTLRQVLNLKSKCTDNSDDDFSDEEEVYIPKKASDAIPYLEKLGIYESLKNKKLIVEHTDDFLQTQNVELKVGILQHVGELSNKFVKKYPEVEDSFPKISDEYGIANDAAIDYYKRLNEYLEDFDLKKLYISLANEFDITPYLSRNGKVLDLSNMQISSLTGIDFSGLSNLKELHLTNTKISSLEGIDFSGLGNLEELYLTNTKIKSLEGVDFSGLSNLKKLNLANTKIKSLEGVDFSGLNNLEYLSLSGSQINSLKEVDFSALGNLYYLFLIGTQISSDEKEEISEKFNINVT